MLSTSIDLSPSDVLVITPVVFFDPPTHWNKKHLKISYSPYQWSMVEGPNSHDLH